MCDDPANRKVFEIAYLSPLGGIRIRGHATGILEVDFSEKENLPVETDPPRLLLACRSQLNAYFEGARQGFDLKLAPEGTSFLKRVWRCVLGIPFGETRTYQEVARVLGNAAAVRAVGMANGRNPIGIIIPCHRVIGRTGNLVGYGGGLWRKKWLLDHERRNSGSAIS